MNGDHRNDKHLTRLLKTWVVEEPLPRDFKQGVWTRIAQAEKASGPGPWQSLLARLDAFFARPALATAYVGAVLVLGSGAGYWHARHDTGHLRSELRDRYVQVVDPYQRPGF